MRYLFIESHPYDGSFNMALVRRMKNKVRKLGHVVNGIHLVAEGFDPVMREEDLKNWSRGASSDPKVKQYQTAIEQHDIIVFSFPVWWGTMPAVLKGFFDKVFLPGWAFRQDGSGKITGLLSGKKALVITTMQTPVEDFDIVYGNPVRGSLIKDTLEKCGFTMIDHIQIDKISSSGRKYAEEKMDSVLDIFDIAQTSRTGDKVDKYNSIFVLFRRGICAQ